MKKNLVLLTGIVFVLTILLAGGCGSEKKQKETADEETPDAFAETAEADDPTKIDIYLMDSVINDTVHLFMFNEKKPECGGVIDDHLAVAKRGHTVKWSNAKKSEIDKILHIRPVGDSTFFGAVPIIDSIEVEPAEFFILNKGALKLKIPDDAKLDTLIKYEIIFTIKKDTFTIDPYLKVPRQQ